MADDDCTPVAPPVTDAPATPSHDGTHEMAVIVPGTAAKPLNIPPPPDIGGLEKKGL